MCFLCSVMGAFWIAPTLNHFAHLPWPLAILGLLLFGLFNEAQFQLFALLMHHARTRFGFRAWSWAGIAFFSAAYTGIEFLTPKIFTNVIGHSQHNIPWMRMWASVGGVPAVSLFLVSVNVALFSVLVALKDRTLRDLLGQRKALTLCPLLLMCTALGGGALLNESRKPNRSGKTIQAAVIQANIGDFDKVAAITGKYAAGEKIIRTYLDASTEALKHPEKPEVIIWPETAYPSTFRKPMVSVELERDQMVERWAIANQTPLWFGGYDRSDSHDYNALFFLSPTPQSAEDLQTYHKTVLLPFGEYIPLADRLKWVRDRFPQVGFFGRGAGPAAYPLRTADGTALRVHPIICYEALFPEFTRGGALAGADLILNVTNDSWFGSFGEPQMHFALSVFRSIETGLPQLRATNTGISALILPDGSLENVGETGVFKILHYTIPLEKRATLFLLVGNALGWVCALGALAVVVGHFLRLRRRPSPKG